MHRQTRRDFLFTGAAAALAGALPAQAAKRSATDWVTLGKTNVKVTRLAFGTGTFSGRVQRELGQEGFTRLVRHAYDSGIRFFETADAYTGMPQMLATALKGIPRDSYKLMTKYRIRDIENPNGTIDRFRSDLNSDYFDILLMHCLRSPTWPEDTKKLQDAFLEAQNKKIIHSHGASVHGLQGLRQFPDNKWLQVALLRVNHKGIKMDNMDLRDTDTPGDVGEVFATAKKLHGQGLGVLGMKLIGEGQFTTPEDREAAMQKVMKSGIVDAVTIGFKSPAEIDESIARMNRALNV
jgi:1-deoxyxylulose-5-phosphate synthase